MGTRSDVFVGMKHSVQNKINDGVGTDANMVRSLLASADDCLESDEGVAYVFRDVKWYMDEEDIAALYELLWSTGEENYIVIEACHDYPDSDQGDAGCWTDNPWHAYKRSVVELVHDDL